jgi:hypothetical protein
MQETTSRTIIRSHIMLDYRHKHRLAETRSQRRPAANVLPLLARRNRRTNRVQYDLENSSPAEREDSQASNKTLEPRENPVLSIFDLHKKFGREKHQVPRATEHWPRIDAWSTFTMVEKPVSERMRGHLHYCKFNRCYLQRRHTRTPSMDKERCEASVVVNPQAL